MANKRPWVVLGPRYRPNIRTGREMSKSTHLATSETLNLTFRPERVAKVIGGLAAKPPQTNDVLSGLLVSKDYSYTLLDPRDLRDFAGLSTCVVTQRQRIAIGVGWALVRWHLEGMYGNIEEGMDQDGIPTIRVCSISVDHSKPELTCWGFASGNECDRCETYR